jgi:hypothetical protein
MICETCRLYPDCELDPPKEGETHPYFEPRERLKLTFTDDGWRMGV